MKYNIKTFFYCEVFDAEDIKTQFTFISELIKAKLSWESENLSWFISLQNHGLIIHFGEISNIIRARVVISEVLARYGWLDSLVKIQINISIV